MSSNNNMFRRFLLVLVLVATWLSPSAGVSTLLVTTSTSDGTDLAAINVIYKKTATNCGCPGCSGCSSGDCEQYTTSIAPNVNGNMFSFVPNNCGGFWQDCICNAAFSDQFVTMSNARSTTSTLQGFFSVTANGSAGTSASVTCTPNTTSAEMLCDDAVVSWDINAEQTYTVAVTLAAAVS